MKARAGRGGFTLLEILVVLGILGILGAIGYSSYLRSIRLGQLREAAYQVASDLRSARSSAMRLSQSASVSWAASGAVTSYSVVTAGSSSARSVPNTLSFSCQSGCATKSIIYTAPYGELGGATGSILSFSSPSINATIYVKIVGVTGKVMVTDTL